MKAPEQLLKQVELVHTSLLGLALIALVLMVGLLLPVIGYNPLNSHVIAGLIVVVAGIGIAYLYILNYGAHKIILDQARLTDVLINALGQGFLSFDAKGLCGPVYSQACSSLLKAHAIAGCHVMDILAIKDEARGEFMEWLGVLFMPGHALSFEDACRFLPQTLVHDDGHVVELAYRPVYNKDKNLTRIVLIATDKTEEREAQKRAEQERQFAAMVCAIFSERQSFVLTMSEFKIMLEQLARQDAAIYTQSFFRDIHTLKGAALHFKIDALGEALHALEETLRAAKKMNDQAFKEALAQHRASLQLEYGRVQNVMRDMLGNEDDKPQDLIEVDEESVYRFGRLLKQQNVSPDIYHAYQSSILSVPLFSLLKSLDRQMLPVAEKLEKKVKPIIFKGESVRLPARPLQRLLMALTHVVHNILDHGIEAPITRMAKGKDPFGTVTIEVKYADDEGMKWIDIIISDDGAGIDPNRVRAKLMIADPEGSWRFDDDRAVIQQLLFHEVSTRDEVSMLSGRGAGMAAIYQEVLRLGGRTFLTSEMHKGTTLTLRLPEKLEGAGL